MQINSLTPTSLSSTVWTNATRTLTADPATDAGAATLVWTHAARTLTADPFTDAVGGLAVWTHATRNMTTPTTSEGLGTGNVTVGFTASSGYGAWAQLLASSAAISTHLILSIDSNNIAVSNEFFVEIGTGPGGSEVVKVNALMGTVEALNSHLQVVIPIVIPAGTRIAARAASASGSSVSAAFALME